jgi:hypothetical protein
LKTDTIEAGMGGTRGLEPGKRKEICPETQFK